MYSIFGNGVNMLGNFFKEQKKSFIKRIIFLILCLNIVLIVLFVGMTYFMTRLNVQDNIRETAEYTSVFAADKLDYCFGDLEDITGFMKNNRIVLDYMNGTSEIADEVISELNSLTMASGGTHVWCISDSRSTAVTTEGETQFLSGDFQWYNDAESLGGTGVRFYRVTDNYGSISGDNSDIIAVCPVFENEQFIGCVGAELPSEALENAIGTSIYADGVYVAVIDRNNVPTESDYTSAINDLFERSDTTLETLLEQEGQNGVLRSFSTGYIITQKNVSGWGIAVILDSRISDGGFTKMYVQQIMVLTCLFILELIAVLNIIRHEAKDIPEISESIAMISEGNYNFRINSASENEIGLIANSVDSLAQNLQDKSMKIDEFESLDVTTGLKNRYKLYEYLKDLIAAHADEDEPKEHFALLFIDIDNFKWITETLGHRHGDLFLKLFGQRLKDRVPQVFRFSGDEFVIITRIDGDRGKVDEIVNALKQDFMEPIVILNDELYANFSVGVSVFSTDDVTPDKLLRDADIALNRAKEKGKGRREFYSTSFHQKVKNKALIAQKLNNALSNNEMFLNFQPIISVSNGDIHGFEVLVRWDSDELGSVNPFTFVQIAEETGAIVDIGTWVFETACRYLRKMNEYNKDIIMSINVSGVQLKKKDFLPMIMRTIGVFGVNPANIQIEITETCLVDFMDDNNDIIKQIADMGISLALDDFGTGYSSFGYLKDMPVKCLKVDKSFIDEISSKHKDYQITGSIIDMVRGLGIKTVVEGVETIEQYNILSEMKCDYIQGFLMSKPLNANDAMEFVMRYDELHKPNRRSLEQSSQKLAEEKKASLNK